MSQLMKILGLDVKPLVKLLLVFKVNIQTIPHNFCYVCCFIFYNSYLIHNCWNIYGGGQNMKCHLDKYILFACNSGWFPLNCLQCVLFIRIHMIGTYTFKQAVISFDPNLYSMNICKKILLLGNFRPAAASVRKSKMTFFDF